MASPEAGADRALTVKVRGALLFAGHMEVTCLRWCRTAAGCAAGVCLSVCGSGSVSEDGRWAPDFLPARSDRLSLGLLTLLVEGLVHRSLTPTRSTYTENGSPGMSVPPKPAYRTSRYCQGPPRSL